MGMAGLGSIIRGSIEELEIGYPWRMVKWHFLPDFSGAGRWRGGCGTAWEIENLGSDVTVATGSSDGDVTQPAGVLGGQPGPRCSMYVRRGDEVEPVKTHRMVPVKHGEILGKISGGGGGVGSPLDRDPERVRLDVTNEKVTVEFARSAYGVILDPENLGLDLAATEDLRAQLRTRP
jgi:N-methylhydantoinase B